MLDNIRSVLDEVGQRFRDTRIHLCQLEVTALDGGRCALSGMVLDAATLGAVTADLGERFPGVTFDIATVTVLRAGPAKPMVVATNLTGLYAGPSFLAEMVSQFLNGWSVEVLREQDHWALVSVPEQAGDGRGYLGWTYRPYLTTVPTPTPTHMICEPVSLLRSAATADSPSVSRVFGGTAVHVVAVRDGWAQLLLAGDPAALLRPGLTGWVPEIHLRSLAAMPADQADRRRQIVADAVRLVGVPYLWGGCTALGVDCSGFAQMLHRLIGLTLPRDADMQFEAGRPVTESFQPGDLLFFAENGEKRKITHVGMSLGSWRIIHSSRSRNGVYEDDVQAVPHLRESFVGARTFLVDGR